MIHRLLVMALLFILPLVSLAQLDERKLDSLSRAIDSSSRISRLSIDSLKQVLDSVMRTPQSMDSTTVFSTPAPVEDHQASFPAVFWSATFLLVVGLFAMILALGQRMNNKE